MKYLATFMLCCWLAAGSAHAASTDEKTAPSEVGGFKLGTSIEEYDFISYRNFLKQVVIDKFPGFRKGVIEYGVCDRPGEIVKIKLKYQDQSHSFYKKLLKRYEKKYGEPDEYVGDSFGIVKAWKWNFNNNGNRVTMLLQHNLKNTDEVIGNMVKLSMPDRVEAERKCFNRTCAMRHPDGVAMEREQDKLDESTWQKMIPR